MMDDPELLRRYAESRSEEAFAELVRRRIGLVYSVALRHTGDAHRAEDVTQAVFAALARKAGELARRPVLVGWLYRSAQFAASDAVRVEVRRQAREQEAHIMNEIERESPAPDWERLRAVLDDVLGDLAESDRDAVLLRYFDGQPFAEIGAKLRLSENAARMRVERALEKLHAALARRGVKSTAAALGLALAGQAGVAAPAGLAASATAAAMAGAGTASALSAAGTGGVAAIFVGMTKLQIGIVSAFALAGAAGYVVQGRTNAALRREVAAAREQQQTVAALKVENRQLVSVAAEVEGLRRDDDELKQLAQRVAEVKRVSEERARLARAQELQKEQERGLLERLRVVREWLDQKNREGHALVDEYKVLAVRAKDEGRTEDERAQADAMRHKKILEIGKKQREMKSNMQVHEFLMQRIEQISGRPRAAGGGEQADAVWSFLSSDTPGKVPVPVRIEGKPSGGSSSPSGGAQAGLRP